MNIDFETMREPGFFHRIKNDVQISYKRIGDNWKKITSCPVCGTPSENLPVKYFTTVVESFECPRCKVLFNSHVPTIQNAGHYNIDSIKEALESPDGKKREYRKNTFGLERKALITHFLNKPIQQASILDVGCNTGFFLELMQPDCKKVVGVEQNEEMCKYVQNELDIEAYTTLSGAKSTYDVITIFDVVEHVENPFEMMYTAYNMLSPGGILVVFTPNWKSTEFDVLGALTSQYYPTDHLQLFCKETVEYIASKLGGEIIYYKTCGMDMFDILAFDRDIQNIDIKDSYVLKYVNEIQESINIAQKGNHLRFIIRKV